jgi:hypothetical protein
VAAVVVVVVVAAVVLLPLRWLRSEVVWLLLICSVGARGAQAPMV